MRQHEKKRGEWRSSRNNNGDGIVVVSSNVKCFCFEWEGPIIVSINEWVMNCNGAQHGSQNLLIVWQSNRASVTDTHRETKDWVKDINKTTIACTLCDWTLQNVWNENVLGELYVKLGQISCTHLVALCLRTQKTTRYFMNQINFCFLYTHVLK